jgi:hypothetical protein
VVGVVHLLLVATWLVWAGCAWWSAPRPVGPDQAERDLTAGRVVSFARVDSWGDRGPWWVSRHEEHVSGRGWMLAWSTTSGQVRYTGVAVHPSVGRLTGSSSGRELTSSDDADALAAQLAVEARGQDSRWSLDRGPFMTAAWAASCTLALICLGWILLGPAPRYGTRWYWFWTSMIPLGLGVLVWLRRERPWLPVAEEDAHADADADSEADSEADSDEDGGAATGAARRRTGWRGLLQVIALGLLIGIAWIGANALFGSDLVP